MNNREVMQQAPKALPVLETVYETIIRWDEGGGKRSRRELARRIVALYTAPPQQQAEPVQERITHITWDERGVRTVNGIPDDAPHRTWVGLTDEEKKNLATAAGCTEDDDGHIVAEIFRLAEAKLRSKNDH